MGLWTRIALAFYGSASTWNGVRPMTIGDTGYKDTRFGLLGVSCGSIVLCLKVVTANMMDAQRSLSIALPCDVCALWLGVLAYPNCNRPPAPAALFLVTCLRPTLPRSPPSHDHGACPNGTGLVAHRIYLNSTRPALALTARILPLSGLAIEEKTFPQVCTRHHSMNHPGQSS